MEMDEELLAEFLTESNENMASIEEQLMELEASPDDEELVNAIFRTIHTVKGSCGFLGLKGLEKTAHAGENLLGKIRSLKFQVNEDIVSLLLACADGINAYLQGLEENSVEPELDHSALIARLQAAERLVESIAGAGAAAAQSETKTDADPETVATAADAVETDASDQVGHDQGSHDQEICVADWTGDFDDAIQAALTAQGWHTPEQVMAAGFAPLRDLEAVTPADALKILGLAKKLVAAGGLSKAKQAAEAEASAKPAPDPEPEVKTVEATLEPEQKKPQLQ